MKKYSLIPDRMFDSIYDITPDLLKDEKVETVIFDIDNTIAPYSIDEPTEQMSRYLFSLRDSGISVALASNNHGGRIDLFNRKLGFFAVKNAKKPSRRAVRMCIDRFGGSPDTTIVIGDQLFTDCLCAHRAGVRAFIVEPIARKEENMFMRFKRWLEKPHKAVFRRRNKNGGIVRTGR